MQVHYTAVQDALHGQPYQGDQITIIYMIVTNFGANRFSVAIDTTEQKQLVTGKSQQQCSDRCQENNIQYDLQT